MISMSPTKTNSPFFVIELITTDEDKKYAPAGRMAATIIDITQETGDCSPQDLYALGYTKNNVKDYWHMAQSLAAVEIKLMGSMSTKPSLWWRKR